MRKGNLGSPALWATIAVRLYVIGCPLDVSDRVRCNDAVPDMMNVSDLMPDWVTDKNMIADLVRDELWLPEIVGQGCHVAKMMKSTFCVTYCAPDKIGIVSEMLNGTNVLTYLIAQKGLISESFSNSKSVADRILKCEGMGTVANFIMKER